jgi:hypothetical protein
MMTHSADGFFQDGGWVAESRADGPQAAAARDCCASSAIVVAAGCLLSLSGLSILQVVGLLAEGCANSVSCGAVVFVNEAAEAIAPFDGGG